MKLFLDDKRIPENCFSYVKAFGIRPDVYLGEWVIVKSYADFVKLIEKTETLPEVISFDHDLADEHYDIEKMEDGTYSELYDTFKEKTGYDAAKWLVQLCHDRGVPLPQCYCHSMNPVGRDNINNIINT